MATTPTLSTLFPYTTLFRSADANPEVGRRPELVNMGIGIGLDDLAAHSVRSLHAVACIDLHAEAFELRSEEHTSELQSLRHLVCRLLLEKKKTTSETEHMTR